MLSSNIIYNEYPVNCRLVGALRKSEKQRVNLSILKYANEPISPKYYHETYKYHEAYNLDSIRLQAARTRKCPLRITNRTDMVTP